MILMSSNTHKLILGKLLLVRIMKFVVFLALLIGIGGCKVDTVTEGMVNDDAFIKQKNQSLFLKVAGNIGSRKLLLIVHGTSVAGGILKEMGVKVDWPTIGRICLRL